MSWICDYCYSVMDETREEKDRIKIKCPNCGTYWYIDDEEEYINDGSAWSPNDEIEEDEDEDEE